MGMLAMYNPQFDTLESVATWENPLNTNQMLTFTPKECWALRQSRSYWMDDARTHPLCQHPFISEQTSVYHCVPLMAQGELLGLLHLAQLPGAIDGINITHRRLAETTAEQIALALANLKLRQTLQNQSIRDPLTNLYNRRYLEETLEREFYRAERSQQPVGIIMVDIDHFKRVNDTFGHDAGDRVLRQLSIFLNEHIRKGDIACRYGGEEFTLILPGANLEVVQRRAELMREKIKHLDIPYGSKNLGPITLSLGVATFPEHGTQLEEVLKAADTALYRAKALGRDRVVIANQIGS
jgi:diguanylate cyclase (GGDEF)-like protein